jgi:voltage-dependent potassium channel beta subunit
MQYRKMGKSGVRLSCLGVGSYLTIGMKMDDAASREVVRFAYDNGINYFDTADAYNKGQAEISLGKILADFPRSSIFLLTKLFWPMGPGPNDRGLSAKHVRESCEASLKRLRMDYVDLLMCHRPDPDTPLEETIRAMENLAQQGKIIYWGVSEWPPVLIQQAQSVAAQMNARAMGVSQPRYSLLWREPEKELFPLTMREGIGNVTFSPLAHGTLTGKYLPGRPAPAGTRAADPETNSVIMSMYWKEEQKQASQEFVKIAAESGVTAAQLAAAWCLRRPEVTSVILGISRLEQLKENLKAVEIQIPPEVLKKLDALFPATAAT